MASANLGVGVIGCGTVGGGVVKLLMSQKEHLLRKTGVTIELRKAADLDPGQARLDRLARRNPADGGCQRLVLDDPDIGVVVEVIGGVKPAQGFIETALARGQARGHRQQGAHRQEGPRALRLGAQAQRHPALRGQLVRRHSGDSRLRPIPGGEPLREAARHRQRHDQLHPDQDVPRGRRVRRRAWPRRNGWATPRPTRPPTWMATTRPTSCPSSRRWPSTATSTTARSTPRASGHHRARHRHRQELRLRHQAARHRRGPRRRPGRAARPSRHARPKRHPLAAVNDSFNAVFARGNFVGDVMFYGRGAGELPTASAIVGDIIDLAMHQVKGGTSPRMNFGSQSKKPWCPWARSRPSSTCAST